MDNLEQTVPGTRSDGSSVKPRLLGRHLACLNERQRTIAWLIAHGHTDQQIGAELNLDAALVADEVEHLGRALGVQRRVHLAAVVRQRGAQAAGQRPQQEVAPGSERS